MACGGVEEGGGRIGRSSRPTACGAEETDVGVCVSRVLLMMTMVEPGSRDEAGKSRRRARATGNRRRDGEVCLLSRPGTAEWHLQAAKRPQRMLREGERVASAEKEQ